MSRAVFFILFVFVFLCAAEQGGWDAGMGGGGYALSGGGNAVYINPGNLVGSQYTEVMVSYSKLYSELENGSIQDGSIYFAKPFRHWAIGLGGSRFSAGSLYEQYSFVLSLSKYLFHPWDKKYSLSFGLMGKLVGVNFPQSGFFEFDTNDPLFKKYGTSKSDFTAGAGLRFTYRSFSFGSFLENIKPLNLSLEGDKSGEISPCVNAGIGFSYRGKAGLELDFSKVLNNDEPFTFRAGLESFLYDNILALRVGGIFFDNGLKSSALGFTIRALRHLFFDYAFIIPTGEIQKIGGGTHRASLGARFAPLPPIKLEVGFDSTRIRVEPTRLMPYMKGSIIIPVVNMGDIQVRRVSAKMYRVFDNGSEQLIFSDAVSNLKSKKEIEIAFPLEFSDPGWYELKFVLDEENILAADDKSNNVAHYRLPVFEPPKASPPVIPSGKIIVSRVSYEKEEYPLVPIFFFQRGKSELSPEFDSTIKIIVLRLRENPDIFLKIRGYFDPDGEGTTPEGMRRLAFKRAESVFKRFVELGANPEQLVVDTLNYNPGQRRAGSGGYYWSPEDSIMCSEENRRVELVPEIFENKAFGLTIRFEPKTNNPIRSDLDRLIAAKSQIMSFLERNSEAIVYFEGVVGSDAELKLGYRRASSLRNEVVKDLPSHYFQRMCVFTSVDTAEYDIVRVYLNGDAITYRPVGERQPGEILRTTGQRIVLSDISVQAGVDSFAVSIFDDSGSKFAVIAAGKNLPPGELFWDGKGSSGESIAEGRKYYVELYIRDRLGQELFARSEPVFSEVKEEKKIEEFVIVNFGFGGVIPNTPFLGSRIEAAARRIVEKALKGGLIASVNGYTDIIGPENVNLALSSRRASQELENLKLYLINLLNFESEAELNKWLGDHKVKLVANGYGESAELVVVVGGREFLVGDNKKPAGRTINRRVTLQIETQ